jgi:hypothetical protein
MSDTSVDLLSRLASGGHGDGDSAWAAVAARAPDHETPKNEATAQLEKERQQKLDQLLGRIAKLTGGAGGPNSAAVRSAPSRHDQAAGNGSSDAEGADGAFFPPEPTTFREARLTNSEVEELALKFLLSRGDASGRDIADQVKLPFVLLDELLRALKFEQLVFHRSIAVRPR